MMLVLYPQPGFDLFFSRAGARSFGAYATTGRNERVVLTAGEVGCEREAFEQAIELNANYAHAWNGKGKVYSSLKAYDKALACYDKTITLDENFAYPWYGKGKVYSGLKAYDKALACYDKAIAVDKNFAYPWHEKGTVHHELKAYDDALACYDKAISIDENFVYPWHGKGQLYNDLKVYDDALACYDKAISIDENFVYLWHGKGSVYQELKVYDKALTFYNQAITLDEKFIYSWNGKGNVYNILKAYAEAFICYNQAIAIDENFAYPWNGKGNVYAQLKSYDEALVCYDKAIALDENFIHPWNGKGNVYGQLKSYDEALSCYDKAITLDENSAYPWDGKGNVYYDLKVYDKALSCYDKAITLNENFAYPWEGKGNVHQKLKAYDEALICYNQAIVLDEDDASAWNGKGTVYGICEEYDLSKRSYIRSFRIEENPATYNNILLLFEKYSTAPFYVYRLINHYLSPERYSEKENLIEYTFEQCQYLHAYIGWLQLVRKHEMVEPWEWQEGIALVNYFMGDPITSFQNYKEVLKCNPQDLRAWYYLIQSCYDFFESEDEYLNQALAIAEDFCSVPLVGSEKDEKFSDYDLQQRYYAGLLFYLDNDSFDNALTCFQNIEENYLPAAYMSFLLQFEQNSKPPERLLIHILEQEQQLISTNKGFSSGILSQELNLDIDDFWDPFYRYAHYIECIEGIEKVYSSRALLKLQDSTGFRFVSPGKAKNFWDAWTLSRESWQRIFQRAREYHLKELTEVRWSNFTGHKPLLTLCCDEKKNSDVRKGKPSSI